MQLLLQNNDVNNNARIPVQRTQPNQHKETVQSNSQVVQNGRSDYSRTSPQGERQVERSSMQMNAEVQKQTCPAEERLIDYPFVPQSQQIALNRMSSLGNRKSEKSRKITRSVDTTSII